MADFGLVDRDLRIKNVATGTAAARRANSQALTINAGTVTDTLTFAPGAQVINFPGTVTPTLPPALTSIGGLPYQGGQMLYTTGTPQNYTFSPISAEGRNLVSQNSVAAQQSALNLVPGVTVQDYSGVLENIATLSAPADSALYTTGANTYAATPFTPFARTLVADGTASDARDTLGAVQRPSVTPVTDTSVAVWDGVAGDQLSATPVTVDASGNVSGVADLTAAGDVTLSAGNLVLPTGTLAGLTQAELTQLRNINGTSIATPQWGYVGAMDQSVDTASTPTFSGLAAGGARITGVAAPSSATDAANKNYVDSVASTGAPPLQAATVATDGALPNAPVYASPAQTLTSTGGPGSITVDGIALSVADRVLVKDQADDRENGVYAVTDDGATPGPNWVLTRASDFNQAAAPIPGGTSIFVELGTGATANPGTSWALSAAVTTVDPLTDSVTWVQVGGVANFSAGDGIDAALLGGGTIAVDLVPATPLTFAAGELDLDTVTVPFGGTGATTLTSGNVLVGQGAAAVDTSKAAPTGDFVGTTDAQTLTNKTATAASNNVTARALFTSAGANSVSTFAAAAPSAGQVLTATGASLATWQNLPAATAVARTVTVAQPIPGFEGDYPTLTAALADIGVGAVRSDVAAAATQESPIMIVVNPGAYTETNPLVVPAWVTVASQSISKGAILYPSVSGAALLQLQPNATIFGLTISNFDFVTFSKVVATITVGVEFIGAPTTATTSANNCLVYDAVEGWLASGNGTANSVIPRIINCGAVALTENMTSGFHATQGASMVLIDCTSSGFFVLGGGLTTGFLVDGPNTLLQATSSAANFCTNAFVVENGIAGGFADMQLYSGYTSNIGRPVGPFDGSIIHVGNFARLEAFNLNLRDVGNSANVTYFNTTSQPAPNNSIARVVGVLLDQSRVNLHPDFRAIGLALGVTPNESQNIFLGELVVGFPGRGFETALGEGDSHVLGMTVFTYNGTTTGFTNVTSTVNVNDGATAAAFASNSAGDALYIGGDVNNGPFYGVKFLNGTLATPAAGRTNATEPPLYAFVLEYWDGAAWTALRYMASEGNAYLPQRRNLFVSTSEQVRFQNVITPPNPFQNSGGTPGTYVSSSAVIGGVLGANQWVTSAAPPGAWQTTTVNGVFGYWVRLRLTTPLTVVPTLNEVKLHTNRTEFNANGYMEMFGNARPYQSLPGLFRGWSEVPGAAPANPDIYYGDTLAKDYIDNRFQSGAVDAIGLVVRAPLNLDSSNPAVLQWTWIPESAAAGTIQWSVTWGYSVDAAFVPGDPASVLYTFSGAAPTNAATQQRIVFNQAAPGVSGAQVTSMCQLDVSDVYGTRTQYGNGDTLWVALQRNVPSDSFGGDVDIIDAAVLYLAANLGPNV